MAKKMGTNPLSGLNSLIRDTQESIQYDAKEARHEYDEHAHSGIEIESGPKTQGRKGQKLPRINMAFSPENLAYLQAIAGFERMSATQYVNNLIRQDKTKRQSLYDQLNALRGE